VAGRGYSNSAARGRRPFGAASSTRKTRGGSTGIGAAAGRPAGPIGPDTPIGLSGLAGATVLRRVGPRLEIRTVRDLLFHLPRRYDDLRELSTARDLARVPDGQPASARLQVRGIRVEQTFRRRVERTTAFLGDDTGEVEATWFGRRFIAGRLRDELPSDTLGHGRHLCGAGVEVPIQDGNPIRDFEGGSRSIQRPAQKAEAGGELIDPDLLLQAVLRISVRVHGIVDYAIHPDGFPV